MSSSSVPHKTIWKWTTDIFQFGGYNPYSVHIYWDNISIKLKTNINCFRELILHQIKVMINADNWMTIPVSILNCLLLNALGKTRSSLKNNWHRRRHQYTRLWKFRRNYQRRKKYLLVFITQRTKHVRARTTTNPKILSAVANAFNIPQIYHTNYYGYRWLYLLLVRFSNACCISTLFYNVCYRITTHVDHTRWHFTKVRCGTK